jgi:hypothetical protein
LRYFIEPVVLTANFAMAQGYEDINMAGLSGGGWSTTFAAGVDKRIRRSFPIAGSVPCAMRNPLGPVPGQSWTGNDDEDYEQSWWVAGVGCGGGLWWWVVVGCGGSWVWVVLGRGWAVVVTAVVVVGGCGGDSGV